jgi:hypothetical protein
VTIEPFSYERNCLSSWQPLLEAAGVPTPRTTIIRPEHDLSVLLDGALPEGWDEFHGLVQAACYDHGLPCFLRTGQGSGKHDWYATCFVVDPENVGRHIVALVEWSHLVDLMGIPHDVFAIRDLIETETLFRCRRYNGFPVTREFRLFVLDGEIEHMQPYWPPAAVEEGDPTSENWMIFLARASALDPLEASALATLALAAADAVGGGWWSVDLLQDRHLKWWVTDMALGERSFRWEP